MGSSTAKLQRLGEQVACVLHRAWDPAPQALDPSEFSWGELAPLLCQVGVAGLAWHRLSVRPDCRVPGGEELNDQYRLHSLHARVRERGLVGAFALLRAAGIEPLAIKGWAIARQYPLVGLRPYGDLDFCVRAADFEQAKSVLEARRDALVPIEVHCGSHAQGDVIYERLYQRSRLVPLHGAEVRIPSEEEHLRLLCLHMLGHGAWRPGWLCDVAVAVETRSPQFDWEFCLRGDPRLSRWVVASLVLAKQLLGARVDGTPADGSACRVPRWLERDVLRAWGRGRGANMDVTPSMCLAQGQFRKMAAMLWSYRRNGVQASFELRAPVNDFPRLPIQLAATIARLPAAVRQAVRYRQLDLKPPCGHAPR